MKKSKESKKKEAENYNCAFILTVEREREDHYNRKKTAYNGLSRKQVLEIEGKVRNSTESQADLH